MNLLSDVITYIRRIIKSPSNSQITDDLLIDYINRFWIMDVDARMQLYDLKTIYRFETTPGIDQYNMPLYDFQVEQGDQEIGLYPVYQGFTGSCRVNGITVPFYTDKTGYDNLWPNYLQCLPQAATGNGGATYQINLPFFPALPGHIDMKGIVEYGTNTDFIFTNTFQPNIPVTSVWSAVYFTATDINGKNIIVSDSGQFLQADTGGDLYGLLMQPGNAPFGNQALPGTYGLTENTVNYNTGVANVTFPTNIPAGNPIQVQCYFYEQGIPRAILYYNNIITVRPPPNTQYVIELEAYLTPAAFLNSTAAIQFAYMAEYLARGAARKILSDTGDVEQFMFYEPLFKEQEYLVWKRSQRQFTANRTPTIFTESQLQANYSTLAQGLS